MQSPRLRLLQTPFSSRHWQIIREKLCITCCDFMHLPWDGKQHTNAVIATSSDEVSKYQRQVSVLLVTWAAHRRLIGKLLVFYSDFKSRWDRCRVISCQSQQNRNPKGKKRRRRNRSICTELSLSQSINQAFIADSKAHKTHTQKKKGICAHAHTHTN